MRTILITIAYIIICTMLIMQFGCTSYEEEYIDAIKTNENISKQCTKEIEKLNYQINNLTNELKINRTKIITKETTINNKTYVEEQIQRYANEIKWCETRLSLLNNTNSYNNLYKNYTMEKYQNEECQTRINNIQTALTENI